MVLQQNEFSAVITSAGNSTRMGEKKEYLPLQSDNVSITVISETLFKFLKTKLFNAVVVTVPKTDLEIIQEIIFEDDRIDSELKKQNINLLFVIGGSSRQESVYNALVELGKNKTIEPPMFILIHDGARPWVSENLIKTVCQQTKEKGSAIPAINAVDTQKIIDKSGKITSHLYRKFVYSVQTPQGFNFKNLVEANKIAIKNSKQTEYKREYTDDSEIYSLLGKEVFICQGEVANKKITYKEDLIR